MHRVGSTRRALLTLFAFLVLSLPMVGSYAHTSAFQPTSNGTPESQPAAGVDLGFEGPSAWNVTSGFSADVAILPTTADKMVLSRIDLEPDASFQPWSAWAMYLVESGSIAITDELGLESAFAAGEGVMIPIGASVNLHNSATSSTSVLEFAVHGGQSFGLPIGTESSEGITRTILFDASEIDLPPEPASLFIAEVEWAAGAEPAKHTASGPVGYHVVDGQLSISREGALPGALTTGKGVVLPGELVRAEWNGGETAAHILVAAVLPVDGSVSVPIPTATATPTNTATVIQTAVPTATGTATQTPLPTNTPTITQTATATDIPTATATATASQTPTETATDVPTSTSTPTPTATTPPAPGTVLFQSDASTNFEGWGLPGGWKLLDGNMLFDASTDEPSVINAPFVVTNTGDYAIELDFEITRFAPSNSQYITVFGRGGAYLAGFDFNCNYDGHIAFLANSTWDYRDCYAFGSLAQLGWPLDGGVNTLRLEFVGNELTLLIDGGLILRTVDNAVIDGGATGLAIRGVQVEVSGYRVITLGGEPGAFGVPAGGPVNDESAEVDSGDSAQGLDRLIPRTSEVPNGLIEIDRQYRTLESVASAYADPAAAQSFLQSAGWQGNVNCVFDIPDGELRPDDSITAIYVSVHQFSTEQGALDMLNFAYEAPNSELSPTQSEINIGEFGEDSREVQYSSSEWQGVEIYIRDDDIMMLVGVWSITGDPSTEAIRLANLILDKI